MSGRSTYTIEAWRDHSCVWFSRAARPSTVLARVHEALADHEPDVIYVSFSADGVAGSAVAQVTSAGFWKFTGSAGARLRESVLAAVE